ncbi:MAG TPA: flavin reductase family protein [Rhodospirillales bacterium]|jgi:flavin reductase (DIM6/NTAB) family NADH-FMN oxidoreductase RutF
MAVVEPLDRVDPARFREVMGRFATGVTILVADVAGDVRGMTANAFMSGSLDPPLCIVSIAKRAHMHWHLIAAGTFSVSILAAGQEDLAMHFAGRPVPGLRVAFDAFVGVPAITGTTATIAAEIASRHECGDHTVFISHIMAMAAHDRPPLLYHASRFAALVPLREEAPSLPEFW